MMPWGGTYSGVREVWLGADRGPVVEEGGGSGGGGGGRSYLCIVAFTNRYSTVDHASRVGEEDFLARQS